MKESAVKTTDAYNLSAKEYEKVISLNQTYLEQIQQFAELFQNGDEILDVGCGPGKNAQILSNNGLAITGLDSSSAMIELAKENCPKGNFILSEAQSLRMDKKFKGICLSFIIVHLSDTDAEKLLQSVSEHIEKEGYVYLSFMTGKEAGFEITSFSSNKIFFNYYEPDYIISVMEQKGLKNISHKMYGYTETDGSITDEHFMIFKK
mgnify:CR=1 FL=1